MAAIYSIDGNIGSGKSRLIHELQKQNTFDNLNLDANKNENSLNSLQDSKFNNNLRYKKKRDKYDTNAVNYWLSDFTGGLCNN